jgi:NAD(P)-dependent dehydrogenase (short-subunit alcohol dehydrogenase family)
MSNILIVGATRGLGASLANQYASHPNTTVYGTTRSAEPPKGKGHDEKIKWAMGIDLNQPDVGKKLVEELGSLGVEGGLGVVVSCVWDLFCGWPVEHKAYEVADHNSRVLRD